MDKKIITIVGSSNMDYTLYVDRFPLPGETLSSFNRFVQPGGKGANQAAAVSKSNLVEAHFVTCLGKDADGREVKNVLSKLGLKLHIKEVSENTGNATIVVDSNSENEIIINSSANNKITKNDIDLNLLSKSEYVILQNEIPDHVNEFVIKKSKECGFKIIFNPAPYREIKKELFEYINVLIVNEIELSQYSKINDIDLGAKALLSLGVKNLIVTLGKNGSIYFSKDKMIKVDALKVQAVDTVAAGDTFVGYFAASLASTNNFEESMKLASRASAVTVSRKGSIVSIPFINEIK